MSHGTFERFVDMTAFKNASDGKWATTNVPTSGAFDMDEIELQIHHSTQLASRLKSAKETLARDALLFNAHSSSRQAKLLREEAEAQDAVRYLEKALKQACDQAMTTRVAMSKAEEQAEIRYLKFEVQLLNLKLWEHLLKDFDTREVYQKKMKPRTNRFNKFSHMATSLDDWIKLKKKLEWIEKALVMSNEKLDTFGEKQKNALKETLKLKANIIYRYNRLNEICFDDDDEEETS
jgi:hypothetical protein